MYNSCLKKNCNFLKYKDDLYIAKSESEILKITQDVKSVIEYSDGKQFEVAIENVKNKYSITYNDSEKFIKQLITDNILKVIDTEYSNIFVISNNSIFNELLNLATDNNSNFCFENDINTVQFQPILPDYKAIL